MKYNIAIEPAKNNNTVWKFNSKPQTWKNGL